MNDIEKVIGQLKQLEHCITKSCDETCTYYEDDMYHCHYDISVEETVDEAIQTIRELQEQNKSSYEKGATDMEKAKQIIIDKLQEQIPKLHLCEEELPQIDKEVLFIDAFGEIFIGRLHVNDGVKKIWYSNFLDDRIKNVIAWMELPKFEEQNNDR